MPPRKRASSPPAKRPAAKKAAPRRRPTKAEREAAAAAEAEAAAAARLERARRVLAWRRSGIEFPEIAKLLAEQPGGTGVPPEPAELLALFDLAVQATLPSSLDDTKRLELDRLERLITPLWTKAMGGNVEAVREVARLVKLRVAVASSRSGLVADDDREPGPVESATKLEISTLRVGTNSLASTAMLLARAVDEADLGTQAHANLGRELRMQMAALRAAAGGGLGGAGDDAAAKTGTDDGVVTPPSRLAELRARGTTRGKRDR